MRAPALAAALLLVVTAACDAGPARPGTDWALAVNRVWISHLPKGETEFARSLVLIEKPEFKVGADVEASAWRAVVDGFEWKKTVTGADARFPQFERTEHWTLRAWQCGDAPAPFDACLVVKEGEKERSYFSADDWKLDVGAIDDRASALAAAERAVRDAAGE